MNTTYIYVHMYIKIKGGILKFNSMCCYNQSDFKLNLNNI